MRRETIKVIRDIQMIHDNTDQRFNDLYKEWTGTIDKRTVLGFS